MSIPLELPDDRLFRQIQQCAQQQVHYVWEHIYPYYQMAMPGDILLKDQDQLDEEVIAKAIKIALGIDIDRDIRIMFVSVSCPYPKPIWMTEKAYRESVFCSIDKRFGDELTTVYKEHCTVQPFSYDLHTNHWLSIWCKIKFKRIKNSAFGLYWYMGAAESVGTSLYYFLHSILADDYKRAEQLEGLLGVQRDCIILGTKADEPDTWLVFCNNLSGLVS